MYETVTTGDEDDVGLLQLMVKLVIETREFVSAVGSASTEEFDATAPLVTE